MTHTGLVETTGLGRPILAKTQRRVPSRRRPIRDQITVTTQSRLLTAEKTTMAVVAQT